MNQEQDFDQTMRLWLDDGVDQAPERFVWAALADVERTGQRRARRPLLEGFLMKVKPAAPVFGVAAAVVLAIALYAAFASSNIGVPPAQPSPTPAPSISVSRLPFIALIASGMPEGMVLDDSIVGRDALSAGFRPEGPGPDETGFVEAQEGDFSGAQGLAATWVALFETEQDARRLFDELVAEHESADAWGFPPLSDGPRLGDERAGFAGAAGGADSGTTYIWRSGLLVLAVVGVDDFDREILGGIAETMAERAGQGG